MTPSDHPSFNKRPVACPIHGKTHLVYFMYPEPKEFVPAKYECAECVEAKKKERAK